MAVMGISLTEILTLLALAAVCVSVLVGVGYATALGVRKLFNKGK